MFAAAIALLGAAPADARLRIGIGEQNPAMFSSSHWRALEIRDVRYLVPWDWKKSPVQEWEVAAFMNSARAARQRVLVAFTAARGCWHKDRYSRSRRCRAPSGRAYRRAVKAFIRTYPWVRTYSAWNEANHGSQPTYNRPALAARYYNIFRRQCRRHGCEIVAADLIGGSRMPAYVLRFMHFAQGRPRLWGLHNYGDVRRNSIRDTLRLAQLVPGRVRITETGGILRFSDNYRPSRRRAAQYTGRAFRIARRLSHRRRGMRSRVDGLYIYQWFGGTPQTRWDSGLVTPTGRPRPALRVVAREVKRAQRASRRSS